MRSYITLISFLFNFGIQAQSPRMIYPVGNNRNPSFIEISGDDRIVVTCKGEYAYAWDRALGRLRCVFEIDSYSTVKLSPDGQSLLFRRQGDIMLGSLKTGQQQILIPAARAGADDGIFSHDGKFILTNVKGADSVRIWSNPGGQLLQQLRGRMSLTAFTSDNKFLVTVYRDTCIKWDLDNRRIVHAFQVSAPGQYAAVSSEGSYFVKADTRQLYIWNTAVPGPAKEITDDRRGLIWGLQLNGNGSRLLTMGGDSAFNIRDLSTGMLVRTFKYPYGYNMTSFSMLSRDGNKAAFFSGDTAFICDVATGNIQDRITGWQYSSAFCFSSDGKYAAMNNRQGLLIYNIADRQTSIVPTWSDKTEFAMLSPGNQYFLNCTKDTATLVETKTGRPLVKMAMGRDGFDCAFSRNGKQLMMWDGRDLAIWSIPDGKQVAAIRNSFKGYVRNEPFISGDGKRVGIIGRDLSIWDITTGKVISRFYAAPGMLNESPALNRDGKILLTAHRDSLLLYNADSGRIIKKIYRSAADSPIVYIYISPDDQYIMTHNASHSSATVWALASGKKLYDLKGNFARFTQNQARIITGDAVYDIITGKELEKIQNPEAKYPAVNPSANQYRAEPAESGIRGKNMTRVTENISGRTYYFMNISGNNYLVFDAAGRYDGTGEAINLLHLACDDRIISSKSVLEKLRVPGLAEKIMKGEEIRAKKLEELAVCAEKAVE